MGIWTCRLWMNCLKGRKPIQTYTAKSEDMPRIYKIMRQTVERSEQIYVVCPLIEDSDLTDLESAESTYEKLSQKIFPDFASRFNARLLES